MKSLLIFILILNLPILSFSQSDCCKQIITTKTNAPFDCLNDVNRKIQNKKISELKAPKVLTTTVFSVERRSSKQVVKKVNHIIKP